MECFFRDSKNRKSPKTCDTYEADLFKKGGSTRKGGSLHLSTGRASRRAPPDQVRSARSARSWAPGDPQIHTGLQQSADQQGINFHSYCSISPLLIRVKSSQLDSPVLCQLSRLVTIQVSTSEHPVSCSKNVPSDQVTVHYKKFPSATGSSKTSTVFPHLPPTLASSNPGNSPTSNYPTSNNPYKTLKQEHFEHCLGTVCSSSHQVCSRLLHLLCCAVSTVPSTCALLTRLYSQVCSRLLHLLCCAVSTPLYARSTHEALLTGVFTTSPPAVLCCVYSPLRALYSRGSTHRCVHDFSTCCAVLCLLPSTRALLTRLYSRLLHLLLSQGSHRCVHDFSTCCAVLCLLPSTRALLTRLYSQVCSRLLHLLCCAVSTPLYTRSTHEALLTGVILTV